MASATSSLQYLHHHHLSNSSFPYTYPDSSSFSLFLKPTTTSNQKLFSNLSSSSTTTTTIPLTPSTSSSSFDLLARHLSSNDFRQADEETRRLLIVLAGDAAQKRGYIFFSEVQFISADDLQAIDRLWREHSNDKFGYTVQRRIWEKSKKDFTSFFLRVGWMKRLDTEVEQYNYRSFPGEFLWELKDETPAGHLPLTNALRGTQLLAGILTHPAFGSEEEGGGGGVGPAEGEGVGSEEKPKPVNSLISNKRIFKSDYSF